MAGGFPTLPVEDLGNAPAAHLPPHRRGRLTRVRNRLGIDFYLPSLYRFRLLSSSLKSLVFHNFSCFRHTLL